MSLRASQPSRLDRIVVVSAVTCAAVALAALSVLAWYHRAFTVDDAFITLRYSMNLARGDGPTWNPGDPPVEGYTTALWMALMALPHLLGLDALSFAKVTGFVAALACVGCAAWLAAGLRRSSSLASRVIAAASAVVLVAGSLSMAVHAISGMETTLFAFLLTAFFAALLEWLRRTPTRRTRLVLGAIALAAALTRPEGNLVVGVAFGVAFLVERARRREIALVAGVGWLLPYAAYYTWRYAYYGLFAPLSFYVKAMNDTVWLRGLDEAYGFLHLLFVAQPYIGIFAVIGAWRHRRALLPVVAAVFAFVFFFLVPAPIMAYERRYLFPVLPTICAIAAAGAGIAAEWISVRWRRSRNLETGVAAAALVAFVVLAAAQIQRHAAGSVAGWTAYGEGLFRAHVQLGRDLRDRTRASASAPTVALVDVGAVAYVSGWRTIDTFGLNDAHIARTGRHDPEYVRRQDPEVVVFISQRPDVLVPIDQLDWETTIHDDFVARGYERIATYHFADDYFLLALARPREP